MFNFSAQQQFTRACGNSWPRRWSVLACIVLHGCAPSPDEARQILASFGPANNRIEAAEVLFAAAHPDDLALLAATLNDFDGTVVTAVQKGLGALTDPAYQENVIRLMAEQGVSPEVAAPVLRAYGEKTLDVLLDARAPFSDSPSFWRDKYLGVLDLPAARALVAAGRVGSLAAGDYSLRQQAVESLLSDATHSGPFLENLLTQVQQEISASGDISAETAARMGAGEKPEETPWVSLVQDYLATAAMMLYRIDPQRHAGLVTTTLLLSGPPDFGAEHLQPLAITVGPQVMKMIPATDGVTRRRAVALAGMWKLAEAAPALRSILADGYEDLELRGKAALALSAMRDAETLKQLPEALRQAHNAEYEWNGYRSETALLAAEKEACSDTDSANYESLENPEDDANSKVTEQAEDEDVDDEGWGCEDLTEGDWDDAEPVEPPSWPEGNYEQLHGDLLQALIAYGEAALPAIWQGLGGDDIEVEDTVSDEYGDDYEMGYVSSSEARDAVAEIAPAIDVLLTAWAGSGNAVHAVLLDSLAGSEDPRAMETLLGELQDVLENSANDWGFTEEESSADVWDPEDDWTQRLVLALQKAPRPPITRLLELLLAEGENQQLAAVKVLRGLQSSDGVFDALLKGIHSIHAPVRMEAALAFSQSADHHALESLVRQLEVEDQYDVKRAIAAALQVMPDERALPGLMKALTNLDEWDSAETFARALGEIKDVAREPVVALYDAATDLQRRNALLALAYVDPAKADSRAGQWFDQLVAGSPDYKDHDDFQRVVEVLRIAAQPEGVRRMLGFLRTHPEDGRRTDVIMAVKDNPDPLVGEFLMAALQKKDIEVVAAAYRFFIRAGSGEEQLVDALDEYGDEEMATVYLNCGNSRLEKAARDWVENRGGLIVWTPGISGGVSWGGLY